MKFILPALIGLAAICLGGAAGIGAGNLYLKVKKDVQGPRMVAVSPTAPITQFVPTPEMSVQAPKQEQMEVIELNQDNMVIMDQAFDDNSVTKVMQELQALSDKLPKDKVIYLVLNSPGGSVPSGQLLISFIKALPQKVKTLTIFAASMGFQTVQSLDERLILDSGSMMSHRAKFSVGGEGPGEIYSRLKWIMSMVDALDANAAERMSMSFEQYRTLIQDEYWVYGKNAVNDKAADRMVLAKCDKSLSGTRSVTVETMFGNFEVLLSKCPLIPGMLGVKSQTNETPETQEARNYVKQMFTDRNQFTRDYILTNKYEKFLKRK